MRFVKYTLIGLIAITLSFFSFGLFHPTIEYENQIELRTSIEKSYDIFIQDSLRSEWLNSYIGYEVLSGTPNTEGARLLIKYENNGDTYEMIHIVKSFKENEKYIFDMETEMFNGTVKIYFEGDNKNTTINIYSSISGTNLFYQSMFYIMKSVFQKQSQMEYELLKEVIENHK